MRLKKLNYSLVFDMKASCARALSVILCLSLVLGITFGVTGCDFNITRGFNVAQKSLSESELARLVTNSIVYENSVADCYGKIPANQLDGLSYSMFSDYCSVLRKCSQIHGTADSFKILTEAEKWNYFLKLDSDNENVKTIDIYGDMDVIELCYSKDRAPSAPAVRFTIAKNDDGYSIAGEYITESMLAYSYMNHYFTMIEEGNVDGLEAIIKSSYTSDIYLNSVIKSKADAIIDFYRFKVKTAREDFELELFAPTTITYYIPEVFSDDGNSIRSKRVSLNLSVNDEYLIEDDIPQVIKELRLYKNGEFKLRMGSVYTRGELNSLLGEAKLVTKTKDCVILVYDGVTIRLDAEISEDGSWYSGKLSSVLIRNDSVYSFGEDIFIGMNISELLLIYPMLDQSDYTGSFYNDSGVFYLSFEFNGYGNISRINISTSIS